MYLWHTAHLQTSMMGSIRGLVATVLLLGLLATPAVQADEESYCQLAKRVVPAVLGKATARLSDLNSTTGPGDVKTLRQAVLLAREALDIFAFAYPKSCPLVKLKQKGNSIDVWQRLRRDLNMGYELLGDFQDLDHSGVAYTDKDVMARRDKCLTWLEQFLSNRPRLHYDEYVEQVVCDQMVQHKHMSRLFWGFNGVLPRLEVAGLANVVRMMRASQLPQVLDAYSQLVDVKHVYDDPEHATFHMFRKLIRSVLAVIDLFPELLDKSTQPATSNKAIMSGRRSGGTAGLDKGSQAASGRRLAAAQGKLSNRMQVMRVNKGQKGQRKAINSRTVARTSLLLACADSNQVVDQLRVLFKNLGQVNNKAFAYQFYKARGDGARADKARQQCDQQWADVQHWMLDQKVDQMLTCLRSSLLASRAWVTS